MMTYAAFLLLFLVLPLSVLVIFLRRRLLDQRYLVLTGLLILIALVYMAPWDHIAAVWGLWMWTSTRTWGLRWWAIPPEEYLFCVWEALLAITLTYTILTRKVRKGEADTFLSRQRRSAATLSVSQDERRGIPTLVRWRKHGGVDIEESDQEERDQEERS
jgi:lycopene cyclase domain-containing protein